MINFAYENVEVPGIDPEFFVLWLEKAIKEEGFTAGEVTFIFCNDEHLLDMNIRFLNHDYYTDIITFDYSEENLISGDLFISIDRVIENASTVGTGYFTELQRVCVHGVLHLCGYKDKQKKDIDQMRFKEDYYIQKYVPRGTV